MKTCKISLYIVFHGEHEYAKISRVYAQFVTQKLWSYFEVALTSSLFFGTIGSSHFNGISIIFWSIECYCMLVNTSIIQSWKSCCRWFIVATLQMGALANVCWLLANLSQKGWKAIIIGGGLKFWIFRGIDPRTVMG